MTTKAIQEILNAPDCPERKKYKVIHAVNAILYGRMYYSKAKPINVLPVLKEGDLFKYGDTRWQVEARTSNLILLNGFYTGGVVIDLDDDGNIIMPELEQGNFIDYQEARWYVDYVDEQRIELTNINPFGKEKKIRIYNENGWKTELSEYAFVGKDEVCMSSLVPSQKFLARKG